MSEGAHNLVSPPPAGIVLAIQHWEGDKAQALRLARLLADIEPKRRDDVILAFVGRFDVSPNDVDVWQTAAQCGLKFPTIRVVSRREGTGHPHGCNELWAGTMDLMSEAWWAGRLRAHSVFTLEADGCPLRPDWIDILKAEHARAIEAGKRVTGAEMNDVFPHINGSLIAHLSLWQDRPSLRRTPADQAWDLFHAAAIRSEARPTPWMKNVYGAGSWSPESLALMSKETAWLSSVKDGSALAWAERALVHRDAAAPTGPVSCSCPDPMACEVRRCPCPCVACGGTPVPASWRPRVTVRG